MFIYRLFDQPGAPWEGESHALNTALLETTETWGRLMGEGMPCTVAFEPENLARRRS